MFGRLSFPQMSLMTALGVAGGLYVYKPIFQQLSLESRAGLGGEEEEKEEVKVKEEEKKEEVKVKEEEKKFVAELESRQIWPQGHTVLPQPGTYGNP
ncbi:protein PIGBOS1-like [Callorhinchus milii]|uniref:protein PIGBOS1-like n=1 Tax=Callorhinchus milii TaxID=7868 RepID=UPI001C3F98A6|nr:protein PIGBOS1-like [Callorhinchus milii]